MALPALLDRAPMRLLNWDASNTDMFPPLYHCGGACTMSLNAFAHVRSTPNAIA